MVGGDGRGRAGRDGVRRGATEPLPRVRLAGGAAARRTRPDPTPVARAVAAQLGPRRGPRRHRHGGRNTVGSSARGEHPPVVPAWLEPPPAAGPASRPRDRSGPTVLLGDLNMGRATAERVTGLRPLVTGATFPAHAPTCRSTTCSRRLTCRPAREGRCGCRCRTTWRSSPMLVVRLLGSAGAGTLHPQRRPTGRPAHDGTSGASSISTLEGVAPPIRPSSARQAAAAISIDGCRTVVSGGSVNSMSIESSDPTTDRSRGTSRPRCRAARSTPRAITSDPQTMPVTPRSSNAAAACAPPATVNVVHSTRPSRSGVGQARVDLARASRPGTRPPCGVRVCSGPDPTPARSWCAPCAPGVRRPGRRRGRRRWRCTGSRVGEEPVDEHDGQPTLGQAPVAARHRRRRWRACRRRR